MKAKTPVLYYRIGERWDAYKNLKAQISVCTPGLLSLKLLGDEASAPSHIKLVFSTKPLKGYTPVWIHRGSVTLWYGRSRYGELALVPGGLGDWMWRNNLVPGDKFIWRLYVKLEKVK